MPQTASYAFQLGSDDGSVLFIGGQLLIDNSGALSWFMLRVAVHAARDVV